jgi:hypothetical protein
MNLNYESGAVGPMFGAHILIMTIITIACSGLYYLTLYSSRITNFHTLYLLQHCNPNHRNPPRPSLMAKIRRLRREHRHEDLNPLEPSIYEQVGQPNTIRNSSLYCNKQYKNYNKIMAQLQFLDILQTCGRNRMMQNMSQQKYEHLIPSS